MDAWAISAAGIGQRTGARVLSLLAAPPNAELLEQLSYGPRRVSELRREGGGTPQATLRAHLDELTAIGAVVRRRRKPFPAAREYELASPAGQELRFAATTLDGWLGNAPDGPVALGSAAGSSAVEALLAGWSSTLLRALASGPTTLAELDGRIGSLGRPALERQLDSMRDARLVEAQADDGAVTRYAVTEWLRQGMAPLATASRWERHHLPDRTAPIAAVDAEAGFLLALPLLRLPPELSGCCRLGVEIVQGGEPTLVGMTVGIEQGGISSGEADADAGPDASATGSPAAWLRAAIESDPNRLQVGGDRRLVRALVDGFNRALFGPAAQRRSGDRR